MPDQKAEKIAENFDEALDRVVLTLREAAESTRDLSEDAAKVLAIAAEDVVRVAEQLRKQAFGVASDVFRQASHEAKEHPIASLAAAFATVAALVGVIAVGRSRKHAQ